MDIILTMIPGILIAAFMLFGFWEIIKNKKILRTCYDPVWEPADLEKLRPDYKLYLSKQSEPLLKQGFQSEGTWLASVNPSFGTHATCFLHPQGHFIVEILQVPDFCGIEIISFLDDGSIIETSNAQIGENYFDSVAPYGFLVQISRTAEINQLLALHTSAIQPAIDGETVGLRKLSNRNWRDYACYTLNFFNQCCFEVGKKDNPPASFRFPDGQCVLNDNREATLV